MKYYRDYLFNDFILFLILVVISIVLIFHAKQIRHLQEHLTKLEPKNESQIETVK